MREDGVYSAVWQVESVRIERRRGCEWGAIWRGAPGALLVWESIVMCERDRRTHIVTEWWTEILICKKKKKKNTHCASPQKYGWNWLYIKCRTHKQNEMWWQWNEASVVITSQPRCFIKFFFFLNCFRSHFVTRYKSI